MDISTRIRQNIERQNRLLKRLAVIASSPSSSVRREASPIRSPIKSSLHSHIDRSFIGSNSSPSRIKPPISDYRVDQIAEDLISSHSHTSPSVPIDIDELKQGQDIFQSLTKDEGSHSKDLTLTLKTERALSEQRYKSLLSENIKLKSNLKEIDVLKEELRQAKHERDQLKTDSALEKEKSQIIIESLQRQLAEKETEEEHTKRKFSAFDIELEALKSEIDTYKSRLLEKSEQYEKLKSELIHAEQAKQTFMDDIEVKFLKYEEDKEDLLKTIRDLEKDKDERSQLCVQLSKSLANMRTTFGQMLDDGEQVKKRIDHCDEIMVGLNP
ncbi:hypothetical protein ADUPG1_010486 [Aduncisulcus paluster]|uniref:SWI5-dependent HO expression protein 3 n=1 Tax=Aduncisulcus paluster TaxID=2918883 RepID=A0ABQ5JS68_9EUKA|nr:hypothetical protein ADUPG1_010486 [Aduncisulcus paluster]